MVKKARVIQKAPKVGKLTRKQAKKAVKAVSKKGVRSENAARNKVLKSALKDLKISMNAILKRFMDEVSG